MGDRTYRDPTFDEVARREAREQRRLEKVAQQRREATLTPNTIRHIKRLRILAALPR